MYSINYVPAKNLVTIEIEVMPYGEELKAYSEKLISTLGQTKPGFRILVDMTKAKTKVIADSDIEGAKQLIQYAESIGMTKLAYVVSTMTLKMQMSRSLKGTPHENAVFDDIEKGKAYLG